MINLDIQSLNVFSESLDRGVELLGHEAQKVLLSRLFSAVRIAVSSSRRPTKAARVLTQEATLVAGRGSIRRPNSASIAASILSVLANRVAARAKSRAWRGLSTQTFRSAFCN